MLLLFVGSVGYLIYRLRKTPDGNLTFVLTMSGLTIVLYLLNPILGKVMLRVTHDEYTFVRLAWIVPAFVLIAFAAKELILELAPRRRMIAAALVAAVIIGSGSFLTEVNVPAENTYKIPSEVKACADIILEREGIEDPLEGDTYITVDIQLHDTDILKDGSDSNIFYFGIRQYAKSFVLTRTTVEPAAYEKKDFSYEGYFTNHCRYYICDKNDNIARELKKIGYELLGETEEHAVFENTYSYNLYLVRHGQTVANVEQRLVGHLETPLTEEGQKTTRELGEALKGIAFGQVYSSPLERTMQTARNVLEGCGQKTLEIQTIGYLYDMNYGDAEGMTWDEVHATYGEQMNFDTIFGQAEDADFVSPINGADTLFAYIQTLDAAMGIINTNAAMTQPEDANILLANHSGIRYWLAQQLPGQEVPGGLENASLTVLRYDRGIWRVILMNNTDYDSIPNFLEESNEE